MMSLQSSLLGFAIFKSLPSGWIKTPFGMVENVVLQTTAVATATMPLAGGFVGVIPALTLLDPSEGRIVLSTWQLIVWGMGIAFFGVFFAVPLRRQVILKEKLKFPSGTATAQMIAVLHKQPDPTVDTSSLHSNTATQPEHEVGLTTEDRLQRVFDTQITTPILTWSTKLKYLVVAFLVSSAYTLLAHFFPILNAIPIFNYISGSALPATWYWYATPALSYVGQGMIMGTHTTLSMLLGAILGWGILGPIAQSQGWAPGAVGDQKHGPKGWILWVALAVMIAESMIGLAVVAVKEVVRRWGFYRKRKEWERRRRDSLLRKKEKHVRGYYTDEEQGSHYSDTHASRRPSFAPDEQVDEDALLPESWLVPAWWTYTGLAITSVVCAVICSLLFNVAWYASILSVLLACLLSVLAVRALAAPMPALFKIMLTKANVPSPKTSPEATITHRTRRFFTACSLLSFPKRVTNSVAKAPTTRGRV